MAHVYYLVHLKKISRRLSRQKNHLIRTYGALQGHPLTKVVQQDLMTCREVSIALTLTWK